MPLNGRTLHQRRSDQYIIAVDQNNYIKDEMGLAKHQRDEVQDGSSSKPFWPKHQRCHAKQAEHTVAPAQR
jgi:hypothetical protein